jgi:hypothetical protein
MKMRRHVVEAEAVVARNGDAGGTWDPPAPTTVPLSSPSRASAERVSRLGIVRADQADLADVDELFGDLSAGASSRSSIVLPLGDDEVILDGLVLGGPFQRRAFQLTGSSVRVGRNDVRFSDIREFAHWIVRGDVLGSPTGLTFHLALTTLDGERTRIVSTGGARRRPGNGRDLFERTSQTIELAIADRIVRHQLEQIDRIGITRVGSLELTPEGLRLKHRATTRWPAVALPQLRASIVEIATADAMATKIASVGRSVPNAVLLGRLVLAAQEHFA